MMHPKPQILRFSQIFLVVAPAFILYDYNQAGLSALLDLPDVICYFPQVDTINTTGAEEARNSTIKGLANACLQPGALVGALSCSVTGDALGRRKSIFIAGMLALVGQILQCSAFSLAQFIVGRVILGLGIGQLSVTVPVWQSENSSTGRRGRQVIAAGIFICVGFASSSWINFGFGKVTFQPVQWRISLAIPILFSPVICFSIFALPESTHWLVQKNQIESATDTLAKLNGLSRDNEHVRSEISRIQRSLEAVQGASLRDPFASGDQSRLGYRLALCIMLQTLQQLVGGNLISIYTTTIFEDNLHLQGDLPQILAGTSLTWKLLCSFIAFAAIDYLGRCVVFIISGTGMSLCMVVMAVATSFPASNHAASIAAAVFIFMFNLCYPIGFLGGNFLYTAEIAPVHLRVAMSSISTANHWLWNCIITMITPVALSSIGWKYYIVFAVLSASVPLIVIPFFPETINRNLELIDLVFREAATIWDIVPVARRLPKGDARTELQLSGEKGAEIGRVEQREVA